MKGLQQWRVTLNDPLPWPIGFCSKSCLQYIHNSILQFEHERVNL